ncbi:MAG: SHOCT domain-containing protein, partial [Planctomycetaceae bacterium]|nr:SHOCT domain-containing protein [Planctomycetaceae bacterium]
NTTNLSDELQKLAELKATGILSDEEFQAAKRKLIG